MKKILQASLSAVLVLSAANGGVHAQLVLPRGHLAPQLDEEVVIHGVVPFPSPNSSDDGRRCSHTPGSSANPAHPHRKARNNARPDPDAPRGR